MKRLGLLIAVVFFIDMLSGCSGRPKSIAEEPDIMQIRSICNLATLECYYHNVAKSIKEAGSGISHWGEKDRKFWIEYTGSAKIGIDMSKVSMKIEGNNITVSMPNAKLLSIDIEELTQDFYIISDDGWNKNKITAEDQTAAINAAQAAMKKSVESNSALLLNAQNRAKNLIENYINKMGELSGVSYTIQWEYKDSSTESKPQSDGATEQSE